VALSKQWCICKLKLVHYRQNKEVEVEKSIGSILIFCLVFTTSCVSSTITAPHANAPVIVGPVKKINGAKELKRDTKNKKDSFEVNSSDWFVFVIEGKKNNTADIKEFRGSSSGNMSNTEEKDVIIVENISVGSWCFFLFPIIGGKTWSNINARVNNGEITVPVKNKEIKK
jgi:hypothetical protein